MTIIIDTDTQTVQTNGEVNGVLTNYTINMERSVQRISDIGEPLSMVYSAPPMISMRLDLALNRLTNEMLEPTARIPPASDRRLDVGPL